MRVEIKHRWTGSVIFTAEIEASEDTGISVRLGLAVRKAVEVKANLREANLREANLSGADLYGANLSWANLSWADMSGANLIEANMSGANLRGANLIEADLYGANLSGANLLALGNMRELRTMQIDMWMIGYTADTLQIGCQRHAISKWRKWDSDAGRKWIAQMDDDALEWAERNLSLVLAIIDANPATPTGKEASQ